MQNKYILHINYVPSLDEILDVKGQGHGAIHRMQRGHTVFINTDSCYFTFYGVKIFLQ